MWGMASAGTRGLRWRTGFVLAVLHSDTGFDRPFSFIPSSFYSSDHLEILYICPSDDTQISCRTKCLCTQSTILAAARAASQRIPFSYILSDRVLSLHLPSPWVDAESAHTA